MTAPGPNTWSHASGLLDNNARGIGEGEMFSATSGALLMKAPAVTSVRSIRGEFRRAWSTCRRRPLGRCRTALHGTAVGPRCDGRLDDNSLRQQPDRGASPNRLVFECGPKIHRQDTTRLLRSVSHQAADASSCTYDHDARKRRRRCTVRTAATSTADSLRPFQGRPLSLQRFDATDTPAHD